MAAETGDEIKQRTHKLLAHSTNAHKHKHKHKNIYANIIIHKHTDKKLLHVVLSILDVLCPGWEVTCVQKIVLHDQCTVND